MSATVIILCLYIDVFWGERCQVFILGETIYSCFPTSFRMIGCDSWTGIKTLSK